MGVVTVSYWVPDFTVVIDAYDDYIRDSTYYVGVVPVSDHRPSKWTCLKNQKECEQKFSPRTNRVVHRNTGFTGAPVYVAVHAHTVSTCGFNPPPLPRKFLL